MINASVASAFTSMGDSGQYPSPALSNSLLPSLWFIDSGASTHMTAVKQNIHAIQPYTGHDKIVVANGKKLFISGIGSIALETAQDQ